MLDKMCGRNERMLLKSFVIIAPCSTQKILHNIALRFVQHFSAGSTQNILFKLTLRFAHNPTPRLTQKITSHTNFDVFTPFHNWFNTINTPQTGFEVCTTFLSSLNTKITFQTMFDVCTPFHPSLNAKHFLHKQAMRFVPLSTTFFVLAHQKIYSTCKLFDVIT